MTDAAPSISAMQETCFVLAIRTVYWAHVCRKMSKIVENVPKIY